MCQQVFMATMKIMCSARDGFGTMPENGSMWEAEKRRMRDWEEVKKRLEKTGYGAGVHTSFDISQSSEWEPILPFQASKLK